MSLIDLKAKEPNDYLSGVYRHSDKHKDTKSECEWNRIDVERYLIYKIDKDGLKRDW